ncbi:MAG: magnesium and cobalt transport protein CorA [Bacteroidia bacterium]|nr:magnesium and cobalt transport protein CorA [Bacteroidia bacterium]NND26368.1 magnesium and cobalt transport protein CorA [Flavobacteriaceae bacterium]MBT8278490.1 magnesium and cobalt transport protein CorA [Bacteroidia bacterium]NNK60229.1 magnesium and cobalt transport protein CorA [Flavobacteriaceae bacterium]NNL31692.1 magnesium and cobalt transport protein CorA [Flavobacteriaceae bacterium]
MNQEFLSQTTLIKFSKDIHEIIKFQSIEEIDLFAESHTVHWLNTYGLNFHSEMKSIISKNELDSFLLKLLHDEQHPNKVVPLNDSLFIAIRVLKTETTAFDSEQMFFIVSQDFVWSIQEKKGDYFGWIRERLVNNKGIVRSKKADYLLYMILESIIDNYHDTYTKGSELRTDELSSTTIKPTPEFTVKVEKRKQELFNFKKAAISLRDTIGKLENCKIQNMNTKYYGELKEQANHLITDIDFELQELESKINLIFSIQGHRLNEVMKTLTIFSVIFIPLTFLAGIYGMNFKNIPELETEYGYFILLGVMLLITVFTIYIISKKKWF